MADTLVVPAAAGWSAIATTFNLIPRDAKNNVDPSVRIGAHADIYLGVVSLAVATIACFKIASAQRRKLRLKARNAFTG
jgi:hypothetical protein